MDSGVSCFSAMLPTEQVHALRIFHRTEHALVACLPTSTTPDLGLSHEQCCNLVPGSNMMKRLSSLEKESKLLKENLWSIWHPASKDPKQKKEDLSDVVSSVVEEMTSKIDFFDEIHVSQESLNKYMQASFEAVTKESSKKIGRPKKVKKEQPKLAKLKKRKNPNPKKVINAADNQSYVPLRKSRRKAGIKFNLELSKIVNEDGKLTEEKQNVKSKRKTEQSTEKPTFEPKKKKKLTPVPPVPLVQVEQFDCFNDKEIKMEDSDHKMEKSSTATQELVNETNVLVNEEVSCTQCNKTFPEHSVLLDHLSIVHSEDIQVKEGSENKQIEPSVNPHPYTCCQCNTHFSKLANLTRHIKIKHGEIPPKSLTCEDCPEESFKTELSMWLHFNQKHSESKGVTICLMCGEKYGSEEMKLHIKTHFASANFACKDCAMMFELKEDYEYHLEDHRKGEKAFTFSSNISGAIQ